MWIDASSRTRKEGRGRGFGSGLVLFLTSFLLTACGSDLGPPAVPVEGWQPPSVSQGPEGASWVENFGAREELRILPEIPPRHRVALLFMEGRAATPLLGGGALWPELEGDRVLVLDERGRVERVLQTRGDGGARMAAPVAAIPSSTGVLVAERDGGSLLFQEDGSAERLLQPPPETTLAGGDGILLSARSVLFFGFGPVRPEDPLLWRVEDGAEVEEVGSVYLPENEMLGQLANTGWPAVGRNKVLYFAPALRPEVLSFHPDGRIRWKALWEPAREVDPPRFVVEGGSLQADFSVLQYALAVGPDDLLYLLAAAEEGGRAENLLVFDREGVLIREGRIPAGSAVLADGAGRIFVLSGEELRARDPRDERTAFQEFRLPALDGEGEVDLSQYEGRPVVVNFWASWCPPCRREIPLLDELREELAPHGVEVIGLNEDTNPEAGLQFLEELGGVSYPNAAGRGELRREYGYRGLPYTVILDSDHRVVQAIYGFGTSLDPIRSALEEAMGGPPNRQGALPAASSHPGPPSPPVPPPSLGSSRSPRRGLRERRTTGGA